MKTTIYLIRHSIPMRNQIGEENTTEDVFLINRKIPLSIDGENLANEISQKDEFKNLDAVWSSSYTRAMSTAKYFAHYNNLKVNIDENFGERIQGIKSWDELPNDFEEHQFKDENYKIGYGESQVEVRKRLYNALIKVVKNNQGKKVLIVGHATAMAFLLSNWCDINYNQDYLFNGKIFFDGKFYYCECFKLEFDNEKLVNINHMRFDQ